MEEENKEGANFSMASFIMASIGFATSFLTRINNISFVLGILAVIFGILALAKKGHNGKAVAGIILGILAIVTTLIVQARTMTAYKNIFNEIGNEITNELSITDNSKTTNELSITDNKKTTEELLKNDVEINFGQFKSKSEGYGFYKTELPVTIKNKTDKNRTIYATIEAINPDGSRIITDTVTVDQLTPNQSQTVTTFEYVENDKIQEMKNAQFKVVNINMY